MNVVIPAHAFDYLKIKEKNVVAKDLLSGQGMRMTLKRDQAIAVEIQPQSAVVLKFKA